MYYTVNEQRETIMALQHKTFAMSMFAKAEHLFRAKAEHYEREAEKLQMELVVEQEKAAHLERQLLRVAEQNDRLERLLARHEEG
jgi:predicted RNase H-like nuclease (RuvC/YqgF family)